MLPPLTNLADLIDARRAGTKPVRLRLSPENALRVAIALRAYEARPPRDEIARQFCGAACRTVCMTCTGKANKLIRLLNGEPPFDLTAFERPGGAALK